MSYTVSFCPGSRNGSNRMDDRHKQRQVLHFPGFSAPTGARLLSAFSFLILLLSVLLAPSFAQDWVRTGSGLGVEKVRLAVPDFKPSNSRSSERRPAEDLQRHVLERLG